VAGWLDFSLCLEDTHRASAHHTNLIVKVYERSTHSVACQGAAQGRGPRGPLGGGICRCVLATLYAVAIRVGENLGMERGVIERFAELQGCGRTEKPD